MNDIVEYTTPPCMVCKQTSMMRVRRSDLRRWRSGDTVQRAFPEMRPDDRERLVSGTHPSCWVELFGDDDD